MAHPLTDGELLDADKINTYLNHTMLEPVAYAPTLQVLQGAVTASYLRIGALVTVQFVVSVTGVGINGTVTVSLPFEAAAPSPSIAVGTAIAVDGGSSGTRRGLTIGYGSATSVFFVVDSLATNATVTNSVPWAWANGDTIGGRFSYWAVP